MTWTGQSEEGVYLPIAKKMQSGYTEEQVKQWSPCPNFYKAIVAFDMLMGAMLMNPGENRVMLEGYCRQLELFKDAADRDADAFDQGKAKIARVILDALEASEKED